MAGTRAPSINARLVFAGKLEINNMQTRGWLSRIKGEREAFAMGKRAAVDGCGVSRCKVDRNVANILRKMWPGT